MGPFLPIAIGAGAGLLNGLFGSRKPQTTTSSIDQGSQDYLSQMRSIAQRMGSAPMPDLDPNVMAGINLMNQYGNAAGLGASAASGDADAMSHFMNPYMSAMNPIFDRLRMQSMNNVNQQYTRPGGGAFGNNRLGLAQGNAMQGVNDQEAQFNYQGFTDAMNRALQLAQGAPGAAQFLSQAGMDLTNRQRNWDIGSMGILNQGYGSPMSTTQSTPNNTNIFESMLGGAMTGASFAYPSSAAGKYNTAKPNLFSYGQN